MLEIQLYYDITHSSLLLPRYLQLLPLLVLKDSGINILLLFTCFKVTSKGQSRATDFDKKGFDFKVLLQKSREGGITMNGCYFIGSAKSSLSVYHVVQFRVFAIYVKNMVRHFHTIAVKISVLI